MEKAGNGGAHCHPSNREKFKIAESWSRKAWAKVRSYLQNNQSKKG
jgi:hypothetical protein